MAQAGSLTTIIIGRTTIVGTFVRQLPDGRLVVACNGREWIGRPVTEVQ